jgi:hypothetical protein
MQHDVVTSTAHMETSAWNCSVADRMAALMYWQRAAGCCLSWCVDVCLRVTEWKASDACVPVQTTLTNNHLC